MKQHLKSFIKNWVLPPKFANIGASLLVNSPAIWHISTPAKDRMLLARNAELRGKGKGKRCFVIGNGPSIARQDLAPLADEITICMNWFNRHPIINTWKPTYYCVSDPSNLLTSVDVNGMLENVDAQAYLFGIDTKELIEKKAIVPSERAYFVQTANDISYFNNVDLCRVIPPTRTTAHLAIMLAIYLGCSPIYLIGLDHDWLTHRSVFPHFYEAKEDEREGSEYDLSIYTYKTMIAGSLATWEIYEKLYHLARKQQTEIYNATDGGFLDVFPRADYQKLFQLTGIS